MTQISTEEESPTANDTGSTDEESPTNESSVKLKTKDSVSKNQSSIHTS